MSEERWISRDLPVLEATARLLDEHPAGQAIGHHEIATAAGITLDDAIPSLCALGDADYINTHRNEGDDRVLSVRVLDLRERGRRAVRQWPSDDGYDELMKLLDQRIEDESDPEERSRLRRFRDALVDVGKDVAGSMLTAYLKQSAGLP